MKKLISKGAEAEIYLVEEKGIKKIIKNRVKKSYRIKDLDNFLRKSRAKKESNILKKLKIEHPKLLNLDEKNGIIEMEYIEGEKVRDFLENTKVRSGLRNNRLIYILKQIGRLIAEMHNQNIIHADLTTSNMIYNSKENKIYFIDFGLSYFSEKIEDKAVDLHLLKQSLESKHSKIYKKAFKIILSEYIKKAKNSEEIIKRLNKVELRGRNKAKI